MLQSLDTESVKTLVHAFITSHIDYCNTMLARSPMSTTNRLQRVPNVAARVAVVLGSSTMAWCSYVTLSCTGWMFFNVSTISLEGPFTGVFKARCPSTSWTAEHLYFICTSDVASSQHLRSAGHYQTTELAATMLWNDELVLPAYHSMTSS